MQKGKMASFIWIVSVILLLWGLLTFLSQQKRGEKTFSFGPISSNQKALIIYNPDLFYDLDEQVCTSFAKGLIEKGWAAKVVTIAAAERLNEEPVDLYVFCANTYNWAPDWPTSRFIKRQNNLENKNVIAITLGSGSTNRAQRLLEHKLTQKKVHLLDSQIFWLMRPNEEPSTDKTNVGVAVENAYALEKKTAKRLSHE
ncbi:hypothetical protein [Sediminicola arcticus]|jgi:hypothetical protein|uniref:Flavodoxin-like domain-containing protein n=1 Tax=Sediminicola arcticus TaxID=1574308 RepID=A0ABV2SS06_9FLAO